MLITHLGEEHHVPGAPTGRSPHAEAEETDTRWSTPLQRSQDACHYSDLSCYVVSPNRKMGVRRALSRLYHASHAPMEAAAVGVLPRNGFRVEVCVVVGAFVGCGVLSAVFGLAHTVTVA